MIEFRGSRRLRFDDSLETVLAADMTTPFGAQSTWRQLVDLIGRGRAEPNAVAIAKLKAIRAKVPPPVRAASARALANAQPPAPLVRLFASDDISIAAPILRAARLDGAAWIEMLPEMSPMMRSVLRHRRDLPPEVSRALESFGSVDFVLPAADVPVEAEAEKVAEAETSGVAEVVPESSSGDAAEELAEVAVAAPESIPIDWREVVGVENEDVRAGEAQTETALTSQPEADVQPVSHAPAGADTIAEGPATSDPAVTEPEATAPEPVAEIPAAPAPVAEETGTVPSDAPLAAPSLPAESTFVSFASVALGLPVVAEALRHEADAAPAIVPDVVEPEAKEAAPEPPPIATPPLPPPEAAAGTFQIAELVARIDAYQRRREETPAFPFAAAGPEVQPELFVLDHAPAQSFRFETDAAGVVRWIEGAARAPLIGLSLDLAALPSGSRVDGVAAGAFRRRAGFVNARLVVEGNSDAAGQWRINGIPVFDRASGRFTGYRGTARRPRADEMAEPAREGRNPASDALRQLVHELRTPANAISGFAEMIESQMLGPVPGPYRAHAAAIRNQASNLLGAIDDIDMAARIESDALDLHPGDVPVAPMLARIADDLAPLARLRGTTIAVDAGSEGMAIAGDDRAVERLIARLFATLVSSGGQGERIGVTATGEGDRTVALVIDRPKALGAYPEERLLTIDAEAEADREGAPLLGTGFALRLARNLATELGGSLSIGDNALTLRLPAAFLPDVEQVSSS